MADNQAAPASPGPAINATITEVQGIFPSDAILQAAIGRLALAGIDRADFSLPVTEPAAGEARPEEGAANPDTDVDNRQMRTMHTSMAGSAGAMAAAGAVVATGGAAAVAAAAAAAVGAAAGLAANAASSTADAMQHDEREQLARAGRLVLVGAARAPGEAGRDRADHAGFGCEASADDQPHGQRRLVRGLDGAREPGKGPALARWPFCFRWMIARQASFRLVAAALPRSMATS